MTYHIIPASTNLEMTETVVASHLKYVKAEPTLEEVT